MLIKTVIDSVTTNLKSNYVNVREGAQLTIVTDPETGSVTLKGWNEELGAMFGAAWTGSCVSRGVGGEFTSKINCPAGVRPHYFWTHKLLISRKTWEYNVSVVMEENAKIDGSWTATWRGKMPEECANG